MKFNFGLLKLVYKSFLFGFPKIVYNPFNMNIFHAPYNVMPYSTYINYELNKNEINYINNYILSEDGGLELKKLKITENEDEKYYLSVNIYNCSSPLFELLGKDEITRCEVNTYVKNEKNDTGTLITDYTSNMLSMDPVNIFKKPCDTTFKKSDENIMCFTKCDSLELKFNYTVSEFDNDFVMDSQLHDFTDNIFYKNGVYDKLYYDRSLVKGVTKIPEYKNDIYFRLGSIVLSSPVSVFYFRDEIRFSGGMWNNVFDKKDTND